MFVEERHQIILEILEQDGKVLVNALSEKFEVTPDLIRKDLAVLEREGLLKRVYGGAIPLKGKSRQLNSISRKGKPTAVKIRIAEKAESLIGNGEMIFLDISSINLELANLLVRKNRNVTVVTNMIEIMKVLSIDSRVKLIFIGGKLNREKSGFTGAVTIEWLSKYQFDQAFIGAVGIDLMRESVTTYEIDDALTKTSAIKVSRKSYLVAESAKFSQQGNCRSAALSDFQGIITDSSIQAESIEKLKSLGLEVFTV